MFCSFEDDENFEEYYDLDIDPYQLDNLAPALHDGIQEVGTFHPLFRDRIKYVLAFS